MKAIYLFVDGKQTGPFTEDQIRQAIEHGHVSRETPAWHEGLTEWVQAGHLIAMPAASAYVPPPPPAKATPLAQASLKVRPHSVMTGSVILIVLLVGTVVLWMTLGTKTGLPQNASSANPIVQAVTSAVSKPGAEFIGIWAKVGGNESDRITIEDNGNQYLVTQGSQKMGAVYKDGFLMVGDSRAITYIRSSNHITLPEGEEYAPENPAITLVRQGLTEQSKHGLLQSPKDQDQAIADFTAALKIEPNYAKAYMARAQAYRLEGNYDKAIADFTTLIALNPNDLQPYNLRGSTYYEKADYDNAIADFTAALKIDPTNYFAQESRRNTYEAKGDYDSVIADDTETIKLNPNNRYAYVNRGDAYYVIGHLSDSLADFQMTLNLQSNNANDETGISSHCFIWLIEADLSGRTDAPSEKLAAALHAYTGAPAGWTQVGHYLLGDLAEDDFLKAADVADPKHTQWQYCSTTFFIGMKHLFNRDTAGAKVFLQKCVDSGSKTSMYYRCAKARLEQLSSTPSQ